MKTPGFFKLFTAFLLGCTAWCNIAGAQISYTENFEGAYGWQGSFYRDIYGSCSGKGMHTTLWSGLQTATLTSPVYPPIGISQNGATTITYKYKVLDTYWDTVAAPNSWGFFWVQYGTDFNGPFTTVQTINSSNHIVSTACSTVTTPIFYPPFGQQLYVRFVCSHGFTDARIVFDDIAVNEAMVTTCSGTPTDSNTNCTNSAACAGALFTLSVDLQSNPAALIYQWQSSANGTSWTNISGATASTCTTSQRRPLITGARLPAAIQGSLCFLKLSCYP